MEIKEMQSLNWHCVSSTCRKVLCTLPLESLDADAGSVPACEEGAEAQSVTRTMAHGREEAAAPALNPEVGAGDQVSPTTPPAPRRLRSRT